MSSIWKHKKYYVDVDQLIDINDHTVMMTQWFDLMIRRRRRGKRRKVWSIKLQCSTVPRAGFDKISFWSFPQHLFTIFSQSSTALGLTKILPQIPFNFKFYSSTFIAQPSPALALTKFLSVVDNVTMVVQSGEPKELKLIPSLM